MCKKILGLDLGSNSIGWALLEENDGAASGIVAIGTRIFTKAVEDKVPTPKNVKRRDKRLARRVVQRRAQRKSRMLNYLVSLNLLPCELQNNNQPEVILNQLGDPYELRTKALDHQLTDYEFGRILLHFVTRRGFLSSKKQVAGDLIDDPDFKPHLDKVSERSIENKEEKGFLNDIIEVRKAIEYEKARTLGEYLYKLGAKKCKRNRMHAGGHLRTDRKMYQDELDLIWNFQKKYFPNLPSDFMEKGKGIQKIIFYQRPLKLQDNRIGKCSLEPKSKRAALARLEVQRFRYLQHINNLQYLDQNTNQWHSLSPDQKREIATYFENSNQIKLNDLKKVLKSFLKFTPKKLNLETQNIRGNTTGYKIKSILGEQWDNYSAEIQHKLVEDLLSIKKKSALKKRLIEHWNLSINHAIELCLLELEPGYSNLSLKAINKLLPFLEEGSIYNKIDREHGEIGAIQAAGYENKINECIVRSKLDAPVKTSNPIVNRAMHELKRVVNAIIKQYGKPDTIRIEMARDLEMNTTRYKKNIAQQNKNKLANEKAVEKYKKLHLGDYPSHADKIKYRLWKDQNYLCAYSGKNIPIEALFTAAVEVDHILPFKRSLDDSYMNKVLCYTEENRLKGDRTPFEAWGGVDEKWKQIEKAIKEWSNKGLDSKVRRFYQTEADLKDRDFVSSQLNDTRYIAKLALKYVRQLGCDVSVTKGYVVSEIRHQWGLNSLISESDKKNRTDHRHHAIDAVVIAATSCRLYRKAVKEIQRNTLKIDMPYTNLRKDLEGLLTSVIVSHASQKKLSGALHGETGANYVKQHKGLVYRKTLSKEFTSKNIKNIVDKTIKDIIIKHLSNYQDDHKKAFANDVVVLHKDKKTPIKRVRVLQSQSDEKKLAKNKYGMTDKNGNIFKYMTFDNIHHIEIIKHKTTPKYNGVIVTMMQASHRSKGIKSTLNKNGEKQPIVLKDHGQDYIFIMSLHINDLVSVKDKTNNRIFYRVQKINAPNSVLLRLNIASTRGDKSQELSISINNENMIKYSLRKHHVNEIGIITHDKTCN